MRGLGRALWQKKDLIIGFTLIAAVAAFVVVNAITPRYRSEARLLLEVRENVFMRAEADRNGGDRSTNLDPEAVASQMQVVLSRDLAREVIKKENLGENPEFDSARRLACGRCWACSAWAAIRARCRRKSASSRPTMTGSMSTRSRSRASSSVDFASADPELAARVANTHRRDLSQPAAVGQAGADPRRRRLACCRNREDAQTGRGGGSQGRRLSRQRQSVRRLQQHVAADASSSPRSIRRFPRRAGRRPIWRRGRSNCASRCVPADRSNSSDIANSESMRRLVEQRTTFRSQLAEQSTTLMDQHPRIKELRVADRRDRPSDPRRRRAAGAPARQRRQGRRRPARDAVPPASTR